MNTNHQRVSVFPRVARRFGKPYDYGGQPARSCTARTRGGKNFMRKLIPAVMALALIALPLRAAQDKDKDIKETDRLENAGDVLEEILNVPDDIPQDLLDKAECVVVFPSVLKFAIG